MAYIVINTNKDTGYEEFICETETDLNSIPHKENLFGCIAYVIATDKLYIMKNNSQWEEVAD